MPGAEWDEAAAWVEEKLQLKEECMTYDRRGGGRFSGQTCSEAAGG